MVKVVRPDRPPVGSALADPPDAEHVWLLSSNTHGRAETPGTAQVDAAARFALRAWQILPMTYDRFLDWLPENAAHRPLVRQLQARAASLRIAAELQNTMALRIARSFADAGIPYSFIKGSAARFVAYDDPTDRVGIDVDLAVPRPHIRDAERQLVELGFLPAQHLPDRRNFTYADVVMRAVVELTHYEVGHLVRRTRVTNLSKAQEYEIRRALPSLPNPWHLTEQDEIACYVAVDLHHGISQEISVDQIVETSDSIHVDGTTICVPRPAWLLFHSVFKLYWEGVHNYRKGGYQYADIARTLGKLDDAEIEHFRSLVERWRLEAGVFFTLRRLPMHFGVRLPEPLATLVQRWGVPEPDSKPHDINDRGEMWAKLWGGR